MMQLEWWSGGLWPYVALIIFGFLPSDFWRMLSVFIGQRIDENSPVLEWVRGGLLSQGRAAEVLGIDRAELLDELGGRGIENAVADLDDLRREAGLG